jgi:DNA-binding FadR family transcriptional regulator
MDLTSDGVFAPLRIASAWEQVAAGLRDTLGSGRFAPGDRLPSEPVLAAELGVSRGTLRRAIQHLVHERVVVVRTGARAGTFVAAHGHDHSRRAETDAELEKVLRTRRVLEIPACGAVARKGDATTLAAIETLRRGASSPDDQFRAHRAFHEELLRSGAAPVWRQVAAPLYEWLGENLRREAAEDEVWDTVGEDHARIIDAVARGDERSAQVAMGAHLDLLGVCYPTMT